MTICFTTSCGGQEVSGGISRVYKDENLLGRVRLGQVDLQFATENETFFD